MYVYNAEINKIKKAIIDCLNITEFTIKKITSNKYAILTETIENYKKVKEILAETSCQFFTFTPKQDKIKTLLLKGLDSTDNPDEILKHLKDYENEEIHFMNVTRFKTKNSIKNGYDTSLFVVQIKPDSNLTKIYKITTLNYRAIRWGKIIKRNEIYQCVKCQRFGHTASNCSLQ